MGIKKQSFGTLPDGQEITEYTLTNKNGVSVSIINYGAIITSVVAPDKNGKPGDIVLGFDNIRHYISAEYMANMPYFGAVTGRFANRIAKGRFSIDGKTYRLATNNGQNHLHGGNTGFDKVVWRTEEITKDMLPALQLTYLSKDGEEGYPGNLEVSVVYSLTAENELKIDYKAETDKATPVALMNHSYFNLAAGKAENALDHQLSINADRYLPMDDTFIPSGELYEVSETPFDFKEPHNIGARMAKVGGIGYAHTFVLNKSAEPMTAAAVLYDPVTGREMEVLTTEPGLIFYAGKFLDGTLMGKDGKPYPSYYGIALETQHFPDSPNHPQFPSAILRPDETYTSSTIYKFSVRD